MLLNLLMRDNFDGTFHMDSLGLCYNYWPCCARIVDSMPLLHSINILSNCSVEEEQWLGKVNCNTVRIHFIRIDGVWGRDTVLDRGTGHYTQGIDDLCMQPFTIIDFDSGNWVYITRNHMWAIRQWGEQYSLLQTQEREDNTIEWTEKSSRAVEVRGSLIKDWGGSSSEWQYDNRIITTTTGDDTSITTWTYKWKNEWDDGISSEKVSVYDCCAFYSTNIICSIVWASNKHMTVGR